MNVAVPHLFSAASDRLAAKRGRCGRFHPCGRGRRGRPGFTLLEMLLALSIMAGLLLALNLFVFSMAEVWGKGRDERLFYQHVRAVTHHVVGMLDSAAVGPGGEGLALKEIKVPGASARPELTFTLADAGRLAAWPETPLPDVEVSIGHDEEKGLVLRYRSRLETRQEDEPRSSVISPFVGSLAWDYYDENFKRWETLDQPRREPDGSYPLPARLRLRFKLGTLQAERVLIVPSRHGGATPP